MAQEYYDLSKAAEVLGVSQADVNHLREEAKLYGYRDGAGWKFKKEEIDRYLGEAIRERAAERDAQASTSADDSELLLNNVEYDNDDGDTEATILSGHGGAAEQAEASDSSQANKVESDNGLGDIDFQLADDDLQLEATSGDDDFDLQLAAEDQTLGQDEDLTLAEDSNSADELVLAEDSVAEVIQDKGSGLNLSDGGSDVKLADFDDDDVVLGGSGSDLNLGGDSGVSLIDPADSGLSLDDPIELLGGSDVSLELGGEDMLSLTDDDVDTGTATVLQSDDDFLLTPSADIDADDSDSSSQVIALDSDADFGDMLTPIDDEGADILEPIEEGADIELEPLEEVPGGLDFAPVGGAEPVQGADFGAAMGATPDFGAAPPSGAGPAGPGSSSATTAKQSQYSGLMVMSLVLCMGLLCLCGFVSYDLMRNMWSWNETYPVNSTILEVLKGIL
jgi:hypothetical protein